jgi:predicted SprT family Zn-dependent metalloprotease
MITKRQFNTFEDLFNYYNSELFNGELPEVMINMSRKKNSHGFFAPERWKAAVNGDKVHEISLNPDSLQREPNLWHSTLVHEMVHLWGRVTGKTSSSYHCKKWAEKMELVGLTPSNTGEPGGKKTGLKMTHYITAGGLFEKTFEKIQGEDFTDMVLPYIPNVVEKVTKSGSPSRGGVKIKYECSCGNKVWGKEGLKLTCDSCGERFETV